MSKEILVVAAHADDETLGCGGAIAKHTSKGDKVRLILMADGVSSRTQSNDKSLEERNYVAEKAKNILGIDSIDYLFLPDNKMDSIPLLDIVKLLEPLVEQYSPSVVYTHYHNDLNIDHKITNQAVMTVCRPLPSSTTTTILGFEVLSSTEWNQIQEFNPTYFIDISATIDVKINAAKAYNIEMRKPPHSRNLQHIRALAQHRGNSIGLDAAEAFHVYRQIDK
jgi:LmbE family N-acetylglucosaminyl deacetylase